MKKLDGKILRSYEAYSPEQYSTPWVTIVKLDGKIVFDRNITKCVGRYTGKFGSGEKGNLIVYNPKEGQVFAYGRKNYMRKVDPEKKQQSKDYFFVIYLDGVFKPCDRYGMLLDVWSMPQRLKKEYSQILG